MQGDTTRACISILYSTVTAQYGVCRMYITFMSSMNSSWIGYRHELIRANYKMQLDFRAVLDHEFNILIYGSNSEIELP